MIDTVSIQGFKSLHDLQDLELGCVNVFIGANGSGKSNLLEAVGVLGAAANGRVDDEALKRRGVRLGTPSLYKTSRQGEYFRRIITLQATGTWDSETARYRVGLDNPRKTPEPDWRYFSESLVRDDRQMVGRSQAGQTVAPELGGRPVPLQGDAGLVAFLRGHEGMNGAPASLVRTLADYAIYAPATPDLRGMTSDAGEPMGLFGGRLAEAIEDLLDPGNERFGQMELDDLLDLLDWVADVTTARPSGQLISPSVPAPRRVVRFKDRWMREGRNHLSGYDASEGALYVLFALTLVLHPKTPGFFAVDNFDQAMHPRLARATMRAFSTQAVEADPPRQVLLTTHNPLVLDGLDLSDDRIRLFTVERDASGATRAHRVRLAPELLDPSGNGLAPSRLWVMGRLGGVPNL